MRKIIGFVGVIGSGKNAAGEYLVHNHNFKHLSFAGPLKDAVADLFGWNRELLEGATKESRDWREKLDPWWSDKLGWGVSPRAALQLMGTEAGRNVFGENIWVSIVQNKIENLFPNENIVITDCRFQNEIKTLTSMGGKMYHINRELPEWFSTAYDETVNGNGGQMSTKYPKIHVSEWDWIKYYDEIPEIKNDGTLRDLYNKIDNIIREE